MIEWACPKRGFTESELAQAATRLVADDLARDAPTDMEFFFAVEHA